MQFNVIIEKDPDGYFARVPHLKGCVTQGDTVEEVLQNIKEAIELYLETLDQREIAAISRTTYMIAPLEIDLAHVC
jgi:predicted RNase H-like HicB family nuclease